MKRLLPSYLLFQQEFSSITLPLRSDNEKYPPEDELEVSNINVSGIRRVRQQPHHRAVARQVTPAPATPAPFVYRPKVRYYIID